MYIWIDTYIYILYRRIQLIETAAATLRQWGKGVSASATDSFSIHVRDTPLSMVHVNRIHL